jgi:CRISPR-associated endonuclease Csy4
MKYYQEISLSPNTEISPYFIWQKLYKQLHLALVENKVDENASAIGVSFPEYDAGQYLLGCKLRLLSPERSMLEQFQCKKWLSRLKDYLQCSEIEPVPKTVISHACFGQVKPKGSKEKLARRRAKRKGETFEQALAQYGSYGEKRIRLPYVNTVSQSNGHPFRLFIEKQEQDAPKAGLFSCYGLSRHTTVPLF